MEYGTCCFSGHRNLPQSKILDIVKQLDNEIENLMHEGVTDFISGGALGFDLIAAALVIAKKEAGANIRLIFMLPCWNQDELWNDDEKRLYRNLINEADEVVYISDKYYPGCMKERNRAMVEQADVCICALLRQMSGTSQTVGYALKKGLRVINIAK